MKITIKEMGVKTWTMNLERQIINKGKEEEDRKHNKVFSLVMQCRVCHGRKVP